MADISIADQLKLLVELQKLDSQIYQLQSDLEANPAQGQSLKVAQQQASEALRVTESRYKAMEVKRKDLENDLSAKEGQMKKLQGQLFQVKTNKEYAALVKEIEGLKADASVLEEEILKLMDEVDKAKAAVASDQRQVSAKEADLRTQMARLEEEAESIRRALESLGVQRQAMVSQVNAKMLAQYERILKKKEGLALVPVRNQTCGGCHLVLPPQAVNEVQMYDRLVTCESCTRILYVHPVTS